MLNRVYN